MITKEQIEELKKGLEEEGILSTVTHIDDGKDDLIFRFQGKVIVTFHPDGSYTLPEADC